VFETSKRGVAALASPKQHLFAGFYYAWQGLDTRIA